MNSDHYLIIAEIEFWRDTIRNSKASDRGEDIERMHQALILAQNKLIAYEDMYPPAQLSQNLSIAYH